MRVVHATAGAAGYNGVMRAVQGIAASLREYEGVASVVLARPGRPGARGAVVYPCRLRFLDSCASLSTPAAAARAARRLGAVLHVHLSKPPSESFLAAGLALRLRPLVTVHAVPYKYRGVGRLASAAYVALQALLLRHPGVAAVVSPSRGFAEEHPHVLAGARVVPHAGGPHPGVDSREPRSPPGGLGGVRAAFIGRLSGEKGFQHFALAALRAALEEPRLSVAVVGDGPLRGLAGLLRERLGGRAWVAGWMPQEEVFGLLEGGWVDLVVAPGLSEAYSFTVADALHYGVPVIASRVGAHLDLLGDGYPGLFPPGDWRALQRLLLHAARGGLEGLRRAAGAAQGRLWTWRMVARAYARLYEEAGTLGG